jgi:lauroyl/myristoyl acyltransferase|tara:strand:+ start:779 stop:1651 length:873 start_codon:yes stop_codon:yes gene_type:complete
MKNAFLQILIFFWKIIVLFPRKIQLFFGNCIGYLFLLSKNKRNRFSKVNINLCFPDLDTNSAYRIYKKNIILFGRVIFDTGIAWFWSDDRINKNIPYKINGLELLLRYQRLNNGVLLFFKHSLHLELDSRILAMNAEIFGVERKHNSTYFESIQKNGRLKSMKGIADRNSTVSFVRWLKNGKTVLYAPDQDYGLKKSDQIDFFGLPAATISAPLKIINKTGCNYLFMNTYYEKDNLVIDIEEPKFSTASSIMFMQDLNKYVENKIKLNPEEYLWQHRRFKSTLGKEKIYK